MSDSSLTCKYFLQSYIFYAICMHFSSASIQRVTFFAKSNCSGDTNYTFTDTQDELDKIWVTNSSSIFIMGLWTITFYKVNVNGTRDAMTFVHYNARPPNGRCMNKAEYPNLDVKNHKVWFAARYGPTDTTTKQAIFFTGEWYSGLPFVLDSNEAENLTPRPLAVWSQILFSNASWTSYPENNFNGKATHYLPSSQFLNNGTIVGPPSEDDFSFDDYCFGIIKSAKMGIHGDHIEDSKAKCSTKASAGYTVTILLLVVNIMHF